MNTMGILFIQDNICKHLFYNQICRYKWIQFQILPYKYVDNAELSI